MSEHEQLLRRCYEAFNARDIDAVLVFMHPDVDWPNVMESKRAHGPHVFTIRDGLVERMDIRSTGRPGCA